MELDINSAKAKQSCLEEGLIRYRTTNEDSVANKKIIKTRRKRIVYLVLILSIFSIGFILLFEVTYHVHVPTIYSNNTLNDSIQRKFDSDTITDHEDDFTRDNDMLDRDLLDERHARLEVSKSHKFNQQQKIFWHRIQSAWNAKSLSQVPLDNNIFDNMKILIMMKEIVANASLGLQEEGYELIHDLFLEEQLLQNRFDEWFVWFCALGNFTDNIPNTDYTPELALNAFVILGRGFNLSYQKIETTNSEDTKLHFGKFVYRGENPEKSYVRHVRHILNGIVRLYFKIHNPSVIRTMENVMKKTENRVINDMKDDSINPQASRWKRSLIWKSKNLKDDSNLITSSQFDSSMERFYEKMEILSSHIDRLHERYMTLNELNDDYVSQEFSVEPAFTKDIA